MSCTLAGEFRSDAFRQAWDQVAARHPILRTAFVWTGVEQAMQVVQRQVPLPWEEYDWRGLGSEEQAHRLDEFLAEDRRRGFDVAKAPLMRFSLLRFEDDSWHFIWSHHHLLLDGWSLPLVLKEILVVYAGILHGQTLPLEPVRPFRDYIAWLGEQDREQARRFWQRRLRGFDTPTTLGVERPLEGLAEADEDYDPSAGRVPRPRSARPCTSSAGSTT